MEEDPRKEVVLVARKFGPFQSGSSEMTVEKRVSSRT